MVQRFGASQEDIQEIEEQLISKQVRRNTQHEDDEAHVVYQGGRNGVVKNQQSEKSHPF